MGLYVPLLEFNLSGKCRLWLLRWRRMTVRASVVQELEIVVVSAEPELCFSREQGLH